jgi:AraC family transcriptional regulator of arabinose operon/AraC family transcriptional regulator
LHGPLQRPHQVFDLFHRLEQRWQRGSAHARATCRGLLLELLLELLDMQDQLPQDIDQSALLAGRLRGALEALSTQPMSAMPSMQEYLGQFGCSYAHAERLFRHTFGLSPVGYVHALRMERARLLLRDTAEPISVIAYQVGIDDPAYFSRIFTRYTGISPSAFRRQQG